PVVALVERAFLTGEPVVAEELPIFLPPLADGKPRRAYLSGVMQPLRDARGQVDGVMVFAHEVTELVTARQRVSAAEERLRLALDAGDVGSWEYDARSSGLSCDAKFKAL